MEKAGQSAYNQEVITKIKKQIGYFILIQLVIVFFTFFTPIKTFAGDPPPAAKPNAYGCVSGSLKEYCMLAPLPIPNATGQIDPTGKITITGSQAFSSYVNSLVRIVVGLIGVFAVFMTIIGGIQYMLVDTVTEKGDGKKRITGAIYGVLIAMGAYTILNTINPNLVDLSITLPNITLELDASSFVGSESSNDPIGASTATVQSVSELCASSGGALQLRNGIPKILAAFASPNGGAPSHMTYRFAGGHSANQPPYSDDNKFAPKVNGVVQPYMCGSVQCGTFCPTGQLCLDCSAFINAVLKCAGFSSPGYSTNNMFSEKINGSAVVKGNTLTINGIDLKDGDLVGWKEGDRSPSDSSGHVLLYSEGLFYESRGGNNGRMPGGAFGTETLKRVAPLITYVRRIN